MRKMTPDQAAALKSFYQFIASGDDVLREEAYKMIDSKLKRNQELKLAAKKAKMESLQREVPKKDSTEVVDPVESLDNSQEMGQAPKKRGRKPLTEEQKQDRLAAKQAVSEPKKRGPKPKVKALPVVEQKRGRGRPKKCADQTTPVLVPVKRGRKPLSEDQKQARQGLKLANEPKKRGPKPKNKENSSVLFKNLRNKLSLNQMQMAAVLGISQALVSQVEIGKVSPNSDLLIKVQKMLKTL